MHDVREWSLRKAIDRFEGSSILSVGMGSIVASYLRKANALSSIYFGVRRTVHECPDHLQKLVTPDGLDELLLEMDVVALSLPSTEEVKSMFDERRLRLMTPSAFLFITEP